MSFDAEVFFCSKSGTRNLWPWSWLRG